MKKLYRKLTKEQKERNVVFSSCLSENNQENNNIHVVLSTDEDKYTTIKRLLNDKFFNDSHFNYNIVRK